MDGLPSETPEVLRCLIAESEAHHREQIVHLQSLVTRGESTDKTLHIIGQIEDTLAALRSREAYLRALQSGR